MKTSELEKGTVLVFLIIYTGGLLAHTVPHLLKFSLGITEGLLVISNFLVLLFTFRKSYDKKLLVWCVIGYLTTFSLEVAGVATGQIFGNYHYGETFKIKLWGVPLVIGLNWVVLILASIHISKKHISENYFPFFSAFFLTLFDVIMEPVAIHLDYWHWENELIPVQNYIAWFVISLAFSYFFKILNLGIESFILKCYFFLQVVFFVGLRIIH